MPRVKTETKRNEILEAASRVFAERDFHQVLIDDVAASARVGKGTIYRYFDTKEDLYFSTILYGFDALFEGLESSLSAESSPVARLERIAGEVIAYFSARGYLATLLHDERRFERRDGELRKRRDVVQRLVTECLIEGIERRELKGIDVQVAAELFRGMLRAAVWLDPRSQSAEELAATIVGIFVRGIAKT
jgi:AcrR family transcriptional regulator